MAPGSVGAVSAKLGKCPGSALQGGLGSRLRDGLPRTSDILADRLSGVGSLFFRSFGGALGIVRVEGAVWWPAGALLVRCPHVLRRLSKCEVEGPLGRPAVGRSLGRSARPRRAVGQEAGRAVGRSVGGAVSCLVGPSGAWAAGLLVGPLSRLPCRRKSQVQAPRRIPRAHCGVAGPPARNVKADSKGALERVGQLWPRMGPQGSDVDKKRRSRHVFRQRSRF